MILVQRLADIDIPSIINTIDTDMRPMADTLITAGRAIAGTGALFYIAMRVWKSLANAEPIQFYPLLRPFAIGMVLLLYSAFVTLIEGGLKPMVAASSVVLTTASAEKINADDAFATVDIYISRLKSQAMVTIPPDENIGPAGGSLLGSDSKMTELKISSRQFFYELLKVLYQTAPLIILTLRSFLLIILYITGPISLGLSVWDGFKDTIQFWIKGYIVIFMWLPLANIFSALISKLYAAMVPMLANSIITNGQAALTPVDTSLMSLMLIAVLGYISIPFVANYIIKATGLNRK